MSFTLCVGEALIDFVAQSQSADVGASEFFHRAAGGAVANVSVGIARLGGDVHFAGTLSRDAFGRFLLRTLARENVNVDGMRMVDASTTLAFVARGPAGQRDFLFVRNPGADSLLETADIYSHELSHARCFHFGGVLLSSEPARTTCLAAASSARRAGALVTFDPNARPSLFASKGEMKRCLLAGCAVAQLVKLSDEDLHNLDMQEADAAALLGEVTRAIVITKGARGSTWRTAEGEYGDVSVPRIEPVDTTGAGDAAMAAILWRLARSDDHRLSAEALADATRYGNAAGTLACLREGAIPSLPSAAELETMLPRVLPAP